MRVGKPISLSPFPGEQCAAFLPCTLSASSEVKLVYPGNPVTGNGSSAEAACRTLEKGWEGSQLSLSLPTWYCTSYAPDVWGEVIWSCDTLSSPLALQLFRNLAKPRSKWIGPSGKWWARTCLPSHTHWGLMEVATVDPDEASKVWDGEG